MNISTVIGELSAENLDDRHAAVAKIAHLAETDQKLIIPQILVALKSADMNVRWYLGRALIKIGPAVMPYLVTSSEKETDMTIQKYYGAVFAAFGEEAIPTLVGLFASKNPTTRGMSAAALERIGEPSVPALVEAAHSEDMIISACAKLTLGKFQIYDY